VQAAATGTFPPLPVRVASAQGRAGGHAYHTDSMVRADKKKQFDVSERVQAPATGYFPPLLGSLVRWTLKGPRLSHLYDSERRQEIKYPCFSPSERPLCMGALFCPPSVVSV
jgi:hypothetical protein